MHPPFRPRLVPWALALSIAPGALAWAGQSLAPPTPAAFGLDAPLLEVDRFSDSAATHLKRSQVAGLPGPNQPIHLDEPPFLVTLLGPGDKTEHCYDLDARPARPARFYVFYDQAGNYVLTQFPIVDVAPGDPGYSDLWDLWKVIVPTGFAADNSLRDLKTLERLLQDPQSGYTAQRTGALLNGPIVPEGSTAKHKAEQREGAATLRYAWYRGKRAPYLYFEEHLRLEGEQSPTGKMVLDAPTPPDDLLRTPLSQLGPLRVTELPGEKGYSPLHSLVDPSGEPLQDQPINCPIVGK